MDVRRLSETELRMLQDDVDDALMNGVPFRVAMDLDGFKWKISFDTWSPPTGRKDD